MHLQLAVSSCTGAVLAPALLFLPCPVTPVCINPPFSCRVSCQRGHVSAVRQLLAALHRINNDDCCVLALSYASSTSNTDAIQAVLESPQLPVQLSR